MVGSDNGGYEQHTFSIPAKYTGDQYIANADYVINSKNTLAMRYLFSEDPQVTPFGSGVPGTPIEDYYANTNAVPEAYHSDHQQPSERSPCHHAAEYRERG